MIRRLLIKLIGEQTLKQSIACGSQDRKAPKRGKQGKPGIKYKILIGSRAMPVLSHLGIYLTVSG